MKLSKILMTIALVAATAIVASAASLKVASFTGTLTIIHDGKTIVVKPGEKAPAIQTGDQVSVAGGQAVFESKGVKVTAEDGGAFTVKEGRGVQIASTGSTPLSVQSGGNTAVLKSGDAIAASGKSLTVVAGTVAVTDAKGATTQVATGQTVAPAPLPSVPHEAPAPALIIPPAPPPPPKQQSAVVSPSAP